MIIVVVQRSISAMGKKKRLAVIVLPLLLVSFIQAQSLADLAKKEKERRAALKGRAITVTTADIAKVKKRPAVETVGQEQGTGEELAAQAGEAGAQALAESAPPVEAGAGAEAALAPAEKPAETPSPAEAPAMSDKDVQVRTAELTKTVLDKQERVDLLTLKMNSLYQEFYSLDNLKSREMLQAQISDTYDKLLQAESDARKAEKDLEDFLAQVKKDQAPTIWIR
jgi:hypothetical protein